MYQGFILFYYEYLFILIIKFIIILFQAFINHIKLLVVKILIIFVNIISLPFNYYNYYDSPINYF